MSSDFLEDSGQPSSDEDNERNLWVGLGILAALVFFLCEGMSNFFASNTDQRLRSQIEKEGMLVGHNRKENDLDFIAAYDRNNGTNSLGKPEGFLEHNKPLSGDDVECRTPSATCFSRIQKFSGGTEGQGVIIQPSNNSQAFWVGNVFLDIFSLALVEGALFEPVSDRQDYGGYLKQKFSTKQGSTDCGAIFQISSQVFYVGGEIGCYYFHKVGGEKGTLGLPVSNPKKGNSGQITQYFARGCIIRNTHSLKLVIPPENCLK